MSCKQKKAVCFLTRAPQHGHGDKLSETSNRPSGSAETNFQSLYLTTLGPVLQHVVVRLWDAALGNLLVLMVLVLNS
jgi:hypothetical protein